MADLRAPQFRDFPALPPSPADFGFISQLVPVAAAIFQKHLLAENERFESLPTGLASSSVE
jgi:hypothetical protein